MKGVCWRYSLQIDTSAICGCIAHHEVEAEKTGYERKETWKAVWRDSDEDFGVDMG